MKPGTRYAVTKGHTIMTTTTLTPETLYAHPDGWTIGYAKNALIATDDELNFVIVPIGPDGLLALAKRLYDIGMKGAHHD
jgi:hypothetical protein